MRSLAANQQTKNMSHLPVISFFRSCNKKIYKSPIQPHAWNFKFWLTQRKGSHKIALSWEVVRFTTRHDVIRSKLLQKPIHTLAFSHNWNEIIVQLGIGILLFSTFHWLLKRFVLVREYISTDTILVLQWDDGGDGVPTSLWCDEN